MLNQKANLKNTQGTQLGINLTDAAIASGTREAYVPSPECKALKAVLDSVAIEETDIFLENLKSTILGNWKLFQKTKDQHILVFIQALIGNFYADKKVAKKATNQKQEALALVAG